MSGVPVVLQPKVKWVMMSKHRCQIKALLIEGDIEHAKLVQTALADTRRIPICTEWTGNLTAGLERLVAEPFDVALLNLDLPDSQGLGSFLKIQAQAPSLPVIVLAASAKEPLAVEAMEAGADDYLVVEQLDARLLTRCVLHAVERRDLLARLERNKQELEASAASFRNVIESNADGIAVIDRQGVVRFVNPALGALFGRQAEELLCESFGFPVVAGQSHEVSISANGSGTRVAEMRVVETTWEGEGVHLASLRDVTARKRTEEDLWAAQEELRSSFDRLKKVLEGTVQAVALTIEMRDPYTAGHEKRVASLACAIADEMGLPGEQVEGIRIAALLHDVGKIRVPAEILTKPGQATEVELSILRTHAQAGYDILKTIEFPWPIARIVLQHHERMDGSGYPEGLKGEQILLEAKVLAVSDVVEAMASHRPYRPALGIDRTLEHVSQRQGTLYDPEVVDRCLTLFTAKGFEFDSSETSDPALSLLAL